MTFSIELSVVIPVYNGEVFIRETIESVLQYSSGFSVECIVINDGSTDKTEEILNSFREEIVVIKQNNAGESAAVNRGLAEAQGNFVVVVSADDPILTAELFNGVSDFFRENLDAVAWYPDWNIIDSTGKILKTIILKEYSFVDLFVRNKVLPGPGTWFRLNDARQIGGRNLVWKYVGDYDFWLRLSLRGRLVHREKVLAQWRRHSGSTSISERGARMANERIEVIENFISSNAGNLEAREITLARANAHLLAAKLGFFSRQVNSRKLLYKAFRLNPRFLFGAKPHELVFMILFPLSKIIVDIFKRKL